MSPANPEVIANLEKTVAHERIAPTVKTDHAARVGNLEANAKRETTVAPAMTAKFETNADLVMTDRAAKAGRTVDHASRANHASQKSKSLSMNLKELFRPKV
jgi:hypothetical protein